MKATTLIATLVGAFALLPLAGGAAGQDDESAYVYASYYKCGPGLGQAVTTLRDDWGGIVQKHMDAGHIGAWGVLRHDTGNEWSMAIYHVGPDRDALDTALDESLTEYFEAHPEAARQFGETCPTHEDYVWTTGPGSQPGAAVGQDRAAAGLSVYYVCDEGREAVADLIVEQVWAPIYDQQVSEGRLRSWGWMSHFIGGKYRRLLVTDGADHATLLDARDRIIEASAAPDNAALGAVFSEVCNGHADILWDVVVSRP